MKKAGAILWGVLVIAAILVSGCKRDNSATEPDGTQAPAGVSNEQTAMKYFAANDEFVQNGPAAHADLVMAPTDYTDALSKTDAAITPLRWGRFITSMSPTVTIENLPGDSLAIAHVVHMVSGTLKIRTTSTGADSVITKPFADRSTSTVIFRRVASDARRYWMNWVPVASTIENGGTQVSPQGYGIKITSLALAGGDSTITVTQPDSTWLRYRWLNMFHGGRGDVPQFKLGDSLRVRVTVASQAADTDLVVLRNGFGSPRFQRARMTMLSQSGPDASGYYTRVYEKQLKGRFGIGSLHVGVDAMTKATLYDDTAPYSVSFWGVPMRIF